MFTEHDEEIIFDDNDGVPEPDDGPPYIGFRCRVPLTALLSIADPASSPPWTRTRASWDINEIKRRAVEQDYEPGGHLPWLLNQRLWSKQDRGPAHMARVAWLMNNDHSPEVTIGAAEMIENQGDWPILDGNHRFAAAILRGDREIDIIIHGEPGLVEETRFWLEGLVSPELDPPLFH